MQPGLLVSVALALVAGCVSAPGAPEPDPGGLDAGRDAPRFDAARDSAPLEDPDLPPMPVDASRRDAPWICVPRCTHDSQCAYTCGANPLGANCCDRTTGTCYAHTAAVCPAVPMDYVCDIECVDRPLGCSDCPASTGEPCCNPSTFHCDYRAPGTACPGTAIPDDAYDGGLLPGPCAPACATDDDCLACPFYPRTVSCCDPTSHTCAYVRGFACPAPDAGP